MDEAIKQALINLLRAIEWSGRGKISAETTTEPICPVCCASQWSGRFHDANCALFRLIDILEDNTTNKV